jgi:hypothetical protein
MDNEKDLERKFKQYQELGKENKNVDVAALMIGALDQARQEEIDGKKKRRAYWVSICLPPFGLLYAVRYYFSGKQGGKKVALWCVILTAVSLALAWSISEMFLSSLSSATGGIDLKQIESINPNDLKGLLQ